MVFFLQDKIKKKKILYTFSLSISSKGVRIAIWKIFMTMSIPKGSTQQQPPLKFGKFF